MDDFQVVEIASGGHNHVVVVILRDISVIFKITMHVASILVTTSSESY